MRYLLIEQFDDEGSVKSWRLRPQHGKLSFGSSKYAEVRSPLSTTKGIQGFFEYKNSQWWFVSLDTNLVFKSNDKNNNQDSADLLITGDQEIKFEDSYIKLKSIQVRENLHEKIEQRQYTQSADSTLKYQLYVVKENGRLLKTQTLPFQEKFKYLHKGQVVSVENKQSDTWTVQNFDGLEIKQKTVYLNNIQDLTKSQFKNMFDKESKISLKVSGVLFLILFFIGVLAPTKHDQPMFVTSVTPQFTYVPSKPPVKKKEEPKEAPAAQTAGQAGGGGGDNGSPQPSKIASKIQVSKLSQLIGKVSTQSARTKNIIVTNGIKAGTAPSGRGLAAIGQATVAANEWQGQTGGRGVKIGTIGRGGGSGSLGGIGNLSGGKVGSGDVGLVEDEGEITGGLDREVIAAYIRTQLGQILYCYERQLSATPNLYGKVAVHFVIGPQGTIEIQRISETTLKNSSVEGCILQKVSKWKFPEPKGGTRVKVTYPFMFKSTN